MPGTRACSRLRAWILYQARGKSQGLDLQRRGGLDNEPPVQVSPGQAVNQHLGGGGVGGHGDVVLVAAHVAAGTMYSSSPS